MPIAEDRPVDVTEEDVADACGVRLKYQPKRVGILLGKHVHRGNADRKGGMMHEQQDRFLAFGELLFEPGAPGLAIAPAWVPSCLVSRNISR